MIHFMDQTFCASSEMCANKECTRNLTPALIDRGKKWWGGPGFPVAMRDFMPGCEYFIQPGATKPEKLPENAA